MSRLNLHNDTSSQKNGYINVNINQSSFDDLISDAECTEILALDVINSIEVTKLENTIDYWLSKLRHGGKITFSFVDLFEICRSYFQNGTNLANMNNLLYGNNNKNCISMNELETFLINKGLKVIQKRISNYQGIITAQRP